MIDLHCHTTNSDGTLTTLEILKVAEAKKIKVLSITDHDSVKSYYDIEQFDITNYYKGDLIVGCEFNCVFDGCKIEILGYNFNKEPVNQWLVMNYGKDKVQEDFIKEFNEMVEICEEQGITLTEDLKFNPKVEYPLDVIYADVIKHEQNKKLIDKESWEKSGVFFRNCTTDSNFILYRDYKKDYPLASDISKLIRDNGGKVFIAHLFTYAMDDHLEFLDRLVAADIIDGIECYYSKFSAEQMLLLENYSKKKNLLRSGGSDFHGSKKPNRELGSGYNNLSISKEDVSEWL